VLNLSRSFQILPDPSSFQASGQVSVLFSTDSRRVGVVEVAELNTAPKGRAANSHQITIFSPYMKDDQK